MKNIAKFPWYVLIFSIYPALYYWSHNVTQMNSTTGANLVIYSFLIGGIVWGLALLIFRNLYKASLIALVALLLFWTYGHLFTFLVTNYPALPSHKILFSIWAILMILTGWLVVKSKSNLSHLSSPFNLITILLLVYPLSSIVPQVIEEKQLNAAKLASAQAQELPDVSIDAITPPTTDFRPDIYYIILDSYTRADILETRYAYDNSEFLNELEQMGFFVANCSQSNYGLTSLSLTSSLNFRYLDELYPIDPDAKTGPAIIKDSAIHKILKSWGYKMVGFETGHAITEITDSDVYYSRPTDLFIPTEFDVNYFQTSMLNPFMREPFFQADVFLASKYRSRILFVLDKLNETAGVDGPKFVFTHILSPHPPFVLGPNGEPTLVNYLDESGAPDLRIFGEGYVDQLIFTNKRILDILRNIIEESPEPPIIILQGDHGPHIGKVPQTSILNAYYLPEGAEGLYETISPVNSFRYVLNRYFNQSLPLLPDISRWSPNDKQLKFEEIPNQCASQP